MIEDFFTYFYDSAFQTYVCVCKFAKRMYVQIREHMNCVDGSLKGRFFVFQIANCVHSRRILFLSLILSFLCPIQIGPFEFKNLFSILNVLLRRL